MTQTHLAGDRVAYQYRRYDRKSLMPIFHPRNIAVVGPGNDRNSLGRAVLWNLISNPFGGTVFPITRKRSSILGVRTYESLTAVPDPVDLAIIASPAPEVLETIAECRETGVNGAVILSSGFGESGKEGKELEREILRRAQEGQMRILGPNCFGLMMPHNSLNATLGRDMAKKGNVAFISQSGSISAAVLDWSLREQVGFSAFISTGNMIDIDWGDLLYFLGDDPHTKSIVMYLEKIRDARSFLSAAREVTLSKPIIVLKSGQTDPALQSFVGEEEDPFVLDVFNAAFRRSGILPVKSLVDLFAMAEVLSKQPPAKGPRLTIISNAGGASVQAVSALKEGGGKLASLSDETAQSLKKFMPEEWWPGNPIHLLREADAQRYAKTLEVVTKSSDSDGYLVIFVPQISADPTQTAEKISPFAALAGKPILTSWMGGVEVAAGKALLNQANIPTFPFPDTAARIFNYMWQYGYNLRGLFETPHLPEDSDEETPDREKVAQIIRVVHDSDRTELTGEESLEVLKAYCLAPRTSKKLSGYQLRIGSSISRQLGPVVCFGAGGPLGRMYRDRALALPPLNTTLARRMMEQTRIFAALKGEKGFTGIDLAVLEKLLVRFSQLVVEQRWIKEIEINPLNFSGRKFQVEKARMVLHEPEVSKEDLPRPAIRPYPIRYVQDWKLRDNTPVTIRPIRPEDEPLMVKFHENLSDRSVYLRYFYPMNIQQRVSHERLARICFIDYDREMVLVVEKKDPRGADPDIVAVGRLNKLRGSNEAEFAITISDKYQRTGVGTKLLAMLVDIGREEKVERIVADILPENRGMQRVSEKVGFKLQFDPEEQIVKAVIELNEG